MLNKKLICEMKPQIIPADIAGCMVSWDNGNDVYYVGGVCPPMRQGVTYKSQKAFDDRQGICYIPEHGFFDELGLDENVSDEMLDWMHEDEDYESSYVSDGAGGYTYDDIYDAVFHAFDNSLGYDEYAKKYGNNLVDDFLERVTGHVFDICDWQSPEAYLYADYDFYENWTYFLEEETDDKRLTDKQKEEL